jgi:hypothetical protein
MVDAYIPQSLRGHPFRLAGPVTCFNLGRFELAALLSFNPGENAFVGPDASFKTKGLSGSGKAVQKILGHTDIAITSQFYTDATLEDQRRAMEQGSKIQANRRRCWSAQARGRRDELTCATQFSCA